MPEIVGIRFKRAGKVYYFEAAGHLLVTNDCVVVETPRGLEVGRVVIAPKQVLESELTEPLKPVLRKATPEDLSQAASFRCQREATLAQAEELVVRSGLPMRLLSAEYNLDGSHLTLFFSAEGRVDFRNLVRDLQAAFRTRVELRQIGPRDETKLVGDLGRCGRPLCCASHLCEINTVSIRMAKEQDLPLNPIKISGLCGRLLCCLSYEYEQYKAQKGKMPRPGQQVTSPSGPAKVVSLNPLREMVLVELESQARVEFPLADLTWPKPPPTAEESAPEESEE